MGGKKSSWFLLKSPILFLGVVSFISSYFLWNKDEMFPWLGIQCISEARIPTIRMFFQLRSGNVRLQFLMILVCFTYGLSLCSFVCLSITNGYVSITKCDFEYGRFSAPKPSIIEMTDSAQMPKADTSTTRQWRRPFLALSWFCRAIKITYSPMDIREDVCGVVEDGWVGGGWVCKREKKLTSQLWLPT